MRKSRLRRVVASSRAAVVFCRSCEPASLMKRLRKSSRCRSMKITNIAVMPVVVSGRSRGEIRAAMLSRAVGVGLYQDCLDEDYCSFFKAPVCAVAFSSVDSDRLEKKDSEPAELHRRLPFAQRGANRRLSADSKARVRHDDALRCRSQSAGVLRDGPLVMRVEAE